MLNDTMRGLKRTGYCGDLRISDIDKEITVTGWVQRQRDLGQLIFIDLRDRSGIIQLAFDEDVSREIFDKAFSVRSEFVLCAKGILRERSAKNKDIPTGDVELAVTDLRILSKAQTPPFEIVENSNTNEELRLTHRYLDLRRPDVQKTIIMRHKIVKSTRDFFDDNGFIEIETPILIKSTPEGARDYLVPSRVFEHSFFALPQSPQLYKQLLMLSGFDRYVQIAKCFRDEDLRADRQPEFTQIDLEMSFVDIPEVMEIGEGLMTKVYKDVLDIDLVTPFPKMTYSEAMNRFGSDKPDLRFGMEICDLSEILKATGFRVFAGALSTGSIRAIVAKNAYDTLSRKEIDKLTEWIKAYGARGLAWTRIGADISSSFEKFLTDDENTAIKNALGAQTGDVIFIVADADTDVVFASLGALRCEIAKRLGIIDTSKPNLLWVTDFPLFEYDKDENRYVAKHHPFTAPCDDDIDKLKTNPSSAVAKAYDLILNGNEVGGGSIRINDPALQQTMFDALGFTQEDAQERFGFLMNAFAYGAPPHGGMALGLDRLVMLMCNCDSIRDVIAFPKVANSGELMSGAPGRVDQKQLEELGIALQK